MKDLIVPIKIPNSVNLSDITEDYSGIIICFKKGKSVGYISYYFQDWYYLSSIDQENLSYDADSLPNLVNHLINEGVCDSFKVIEFVQ